MSGEQLLYNRPTFPAQLDYSHPLTKYLAGYWMMNENDSSSKRVWDSSLYRNHGLSTATTATHAGRFFSNTGYITVPSTAQSLIMGTKDFTVAGFVKPTATGIANLFCWLNSLGAVQFTFTDGTDKIGIYGNATWVFQNSWAPIVGRMYYVAFTRVGNIWSAYVDGQRQGASVSDSRSLGNINSGNYTIGAEGGLTQPLNGTIGNVMVLINKGCSAGEIQNLFLNPYDMFLK